MLRSLDQHRRKLYISPRVFQQTFNYVNHAVCHAFIWKPHSEAIILEVIFPTVSYTDADAELWKSDLLEYTRTNFDIFEDHVSPVLTAAQSLLHTICKGRKDMLQNTMKFLMQDDSSFVYF